MAIIQFYKNGKLNPVLFSTIAETCANLIYDDRKGAPNYKKEKNKSTQIRKFFDEIIRLKEKLIIGQSDWEEIAPYVNMLIAKVAYAEGRELVTTTFTSMVKECINQIEKKEDFLIFSNFFESFVAFYKLHSKE